MTSKLPDVCPECGAAVPDGGTCSDNFEALLFLEQEVAANPAESSGGRGEIAHYYAVSSYVLQHPDSMKYRTEALADLRCNLADHLAGRITLAQLRLKVRLAANGEHRITRRAGDAVINWQVDGWPLTIAHALDGGVSGYGQRVADWASSVLSTLDEVAPLR